MLLLTSFKVEILWQNQGIGLPIVGDHCFVSANPPRPSPVQDLTITSLEYRLVDRFTGEVTVVLSLSWTRPFVPYGNLSHYEVWLGPRPLTDQEEYRFNPIPVSCMLAAIIISI